MARLLSYLHSCDVPKNLVFLLTFSCNIECFSLLSETQWTLLQYLPSSSPAKLFVIATLLQNFTFMLVILEGIWRFFIFSDEANLLPSSKFRPCLTEGHVTTSCSTWAGGYCYTPPSLEHVSTLDTSLTSSMTPSEVMPR